MASFEDIWGGLQQASPTRPYLLIDCAGIEGGQSGLPLTAFDELECLFTGDLAVELADVGPYLARVKSFEPAVMTAVAQLLAAHAGMLVVPRDEPDDSRRLSFSQLHRHFRKFNVVYGPDAKPLFFRYYDPRVLVDVLDALEPGQLASFFGEIALFVLADAAGQFVQCQLRGQALVVAT